MFPRRSIPIPTADCSQFLLENEEDQTCDRANGIPREVCKFCFQRRSNKPMAADRESSLHDAEAVSDNNGMTRNVFVPLFKHHSNRTPAAGEKSIF
jgi:hypothetical protein